MFIFTDRKLNTLTTANNEFPDSLKIESDTFNESIDTGTCMLEATILKNKDDVELINVGVFVVAVGYKKKPVLLEITEVSETDEYKSIIAEDCGLDLLNEDIAEMDGKEMTIAEYTQMVLGEDSDWEIGINELGKSRTRTLKYEDTTTKTKRLAQIAGRFDCEISYDVELRGNFIERKLINYRVNRGKDTGIRLEVGREVKNIKRDISITDLCTAVRPIGKPHKEQIREKKLVEEVVKETGGTSSTTQEENKQIDNFINWFKSREGKTKYSQAKRGLNDYWYDCSSAVVTAAKFAGFIPKSEELATTGTLWDWGNSGKYFHQINQSEIRYGDIFVSRHNGEGHTGAILDSNTIIHCTLYGSNYNGVVTTPLQNWTGENVRFYRFNDVQDGGSTSTSTSSTTGKYWTDTNIENHNLGICLQGITADQLNNWIRAKSPSSPFNGHGDVFIEAQKQSGLDCRYIVAHAALESGWGTSRIAREYHNYFGINAYDSNPDNASKSSNSSLRSGIINGAVWIREHYYKNGQTTLYKMLHDPSGNGHNYATDSTWASQIAGIMKGSEKFTKPGTGTNTQTKYIEKVTTREVEMATNLVGFKKDDGRFYVTDDGLICDRQAAEEWTRFNEKAKYYTRIYNSEATSAKTLYDEGLRFLQNNNTPKIKYDVPVYLLPEDLEIGDTVRIIDHNFKPALYLSARLVDLTRSLTNSNENKAVFTNFKEEKSGIAKRLEELEKKASRDEFKWDNIPYEMTIISSNGTLFKDGLIETELQANLTRMGISQSSVVDYFTWERISTYPDKVIISDESWNENHKETKGSNILINSGDVDMQADFVCSAVIDGTVVSTGSITIKDLTIGIYKQAEEPDHSILSWGDIWQSSDEKSRLIWYGDHWEKVIDKHDILTDPEIRDALKGDQGLPGKDGADGLPGKDGADGASQYIHFAYADSADGSQGFTTSFNASKKYIGMCITNTQADPTSYTAYKWSKYVGEDGTDGIAGKDGVGIKATTITYGLSSSETTQPTSWYTNVPTLVKGRYFWTKTVWTYSDNTSETGYTKTYIAKDGNTGADGIPGKDGVGIKTTTITYAKSTSGTTAPSTGWATTVPTVDPNYYLWTKIVWSYTDGTTETGYSVSKMGKDGSNGIPGTPGADGKTPYFHTAWANNSTGTTGFSTTYATNRSYFGTYTDFTEADSTNPTKYTWQLVKGDKGDKGDPGEGADMTAINAAFDDVRNGLDGKASSDSISKLEERQQDIEVLLNSISDPVDLQTFNQALNEQKAYVDKLAEGIKTDALDLEDRFDAIDEKVGNGLLTVKAINTYLKFGEEGVLIGKQDNPVKLNLTNDKMEFIDGGNVVATFSNSRVDVPNLEVSGVFEFGYHIAEKLDKDGRKYTIIRGV
ncbi:MAG: phage tail spike protein [Finegoldia sp.]|nr:phage tail spike protein [Finegoldia sp.]